MNPEQKENYMAQALALARQAAAGGDVPVGCVIVKDGAVIARACNTREQTGSAISHAEILAIDAACRALGDWRLDGCALFVTLEPCPMCAGAILNARIPEVYYGASDLVFGAAGGVLNLFEEAFPHKLRLQGGILAQECASLLSDFFERLRDV